MAANEDYAPSKDTVNAVGPVVREAGGRGQAHLDARRQGRHRADHARELAAVRSIVETCAADLDDAWKEA